MQTPRLQFQPQLDGFFKRYMISVNDRPLCFFNPGVANRDWLDWNMKRPSIHPLYTPAGLPVTEQGAHNYPHHKACWIAHGLVNGVNFYHDGPGGGRILARKVNWTEGDGGGILDADVEWVDAGHEIVLHEKRRHWFRPGATANRIDVRTELSTPREKAEIAIEKHAFFHVRAIEALNEESGSRLRASNGITGAMKIFDTEGNWIDCAGRIGGLSVGVCIMAHPSECPQPLFARPYGTIALNPFFHKPLTLARGQTWRRTYSVVAYDGELDVEAAYRELGATKFD